MLVFIFTKRMDLDNEGTISSSGKQNTSSYSTSPKTVIEGLNSAALIV